MPTEIIIDLSKSGDARDFTASNENSNGDLIHHNEFLKVTAWIDKRVEKYSSKEEKEDSGVSRERLHDTITILGTRGSGKTSFLLSVLGKYKKHKKVSVLNIIDPTLIEEKGHVFLSIIACIKAEVEKELDRKETNPGNNSLISRKQWRDKLKELAHGLPAIDGVGKDLQQDSWQDAEFIMDKGIRHVTSASHLEENFQHFMEAGLKILDKECFIIPFDDIDIDFRKGWMVLETIRKYLTSPRIIVLLSGDMKLFSLGIRKQQWLNFGKALLINEGERNSKMTLFNDRVTDMESQYMQKVLKPNKRVPLTNLYEKLRINRQNLQIIVQSASKAYTTEKEKKENEIRNVYRAILGYLGIKNVSQGEVYSSYMLSLPLRTQIQFLIEYYGNKDAVELRLTDPFLSYLYEKNVSVDLALSSPQFLNQIILELLLHEQYLEEGYQLQPTSTDLSLNGSLIALSFLFSEHSKNNPYLIFDYFIRIGYSKSLLNALDYFDKNATNSQHSPSIENLCKQSGIFQDKVLKDIANRMTAYMRGFLNKDGKNEKHWGGIILLNRLAKRAKQVKTAMLNSIDSVFDDSSVSDAQKTIGYIPLGICKYIDKNETVVTYSVFVLLASIGELIRKAELDDIQKGLVELSQLRTYPMPNFNRNLLSVNNTTELEENTTVTVSKSPIEIDLHHLLLQWINNFPKDQPLSPHLLGKIVTRFFYALNNIEDEQNFENLGEFVHAQIVAFMNSVLIEDIKENLTSTKGININNTKYDDGIFLANLKKAIPSDKATEDERREIGGLVLSGWLLTCPLLLLYLESSAEMENLLPVFWANIRKYRSTPTVQTQKDYDEDVNQIKSIFGKSINFLLQKVSIKLTPSRANSDQTIRVRKDYELLIQTLKDSNVPYILFDPTNTDRKVTKRNNDIVRNQYSSLFKDTSSAALRGFREYLSKDSSRKW